MKLSRLLTLPFLATLFFAGGNTQAETVKDGKPQYVSIRLLPEFQSVTPGKPLTIAVEETIAQGWHTYWKNPGDSGEALNIKWTLPEGWSARAIDFPTPEPIPVGPLVNYGYSHQVTLLTSLDIPADIKSDRVQLNAELTWLVCADICVPETTHITMDLPVSRSGDAVPTNPELFKTARALMPEDTAWQGMVEEQDQNLVLSFKTDSVQLNEFNNAKEFYFFPEDWGIMLYASPQKIGIEGDQLKITIMRDTRPLSGLSSINGVLAYTTDSGIRKSFNIDIPLSGAQLNNRASTSEPSASKDISIAQALALAFLGGLILNLMPCVFPVLSMKALSLIKMSAKEQRHAAIYGISYTAGILVCFLAIAGILIALQLTGENIGWGFHLQNPVVVLALAYLFFIMGLNLSGIFDFKGHMLTNIGSKLASQQGYAGTFFTGMLATIVATPCTAPFMGTAMGFALTQPPQIALIIFAALGFGLAFPFLLLCLVPSLRGLLPRPGAWMETFRQFMAFPLYASVVWLIWVYTQQDTSEHSLFFALTGLVFIGFYFWVSHLSPQNRLAYVAVKFLAYLSIFATLVILVGSAYTTPPSGENASSLNFPHIAFTKNSFDTAMEGDNPLFVDMTAAWCITCKVNERVALADADTIALFKEKKIQVLVGDWTNRNPEITDFLHRYGRSGVPLYIYVGPRDPVTGKRPEPLVLPQLLTHGILAEAVAGLPQE